MQRKMTMLLLALAPAGALVALAGVVLAAAARQIPELP